MNKSKLKFKKRTKCLLVAVLIFALMLPVGIGAFALMPGDEIGEVLHTDVETFINGERIPSYNIGGHSVVLIRDLMNYGFDSTFDEVTNTVVIEHNPNKRFTPIRNFDERTGPVGHRAFVHVHTNIRAVINDVPVTTFSIQGNIGIFFTDLQDVGNFGTIAWNPVTRESRLTLVAPATDITLGNTSLSILEDESVTLVATVTPAGASDAVTWRSSNADIVHVDANGRITGRRLGTATVTATAAGGVSVATTVTVTSTAVPVSAVILDITSATVRAGDVIRLNATITPHNATDRTLTWTSSNPSVASVDTVGRVIGERAGTATITATAPNGRTARATITVTSLVEATSVRVSPSSQSIIEGEVVYLTATVSPSNATDRSVDWHSSNASIASVNQNGRVTGLRAGTATITATTSNGRTARATITVSSPAIVHHSSCSSCWWTGSSWACSRSGCVWWTSSTWWTSGWNCSSCWWTGSSWACSRSCGWWTGSTWWTHHHPNCPGNCAWTNAGWSCWRW